MGAKDILFSFNGRIPRGTFWLWSILSGMVISILMVAVVLGFGAKAAAEAPPPPPPASTSALDSIRDTGAGADAAPAAAPAADPLASDVPATVSQVNPMMFVLLALLYIPLLWIGFALQAKRWHDRGKSAAWILINLVPFVGGIWAFVECGCLRGTVGPNQFGQDPT